MGLFGNKVFAKFGMTKTDDQRRLIEGALSRLIIYVNTLDSTEEEKKDYFTVTKNIIEYVVINFYDQIKYFMNSYAKSRDEPIRVIQESARALYETNSEKLEYNTISEDRSKAEVILDYFSTGGKSIYNSITGNQVLASATLNKEKNNFNSKVKEQCKNLKKNLTQYALSSNSFSYGDERQKALDAINQNIDDDCTNNLNIVLKGGSKNKSRKKSPKQTYRSKYRASRPSPKLPANKYCGQIRRGNDGRMYMSKADKNGRCAWRLVK